MPAASVPTVDAAPSDDLGLLIDAAERAAEIALGHWKRDHKVWDKPGDEGPVTEADYAVDTFLREWLRAARPGYGWMSEETEDSAEDRAPETLFIVDPIDGTRAFTGGQETWAHSLAVVHRGTPVAGVVFLPAQGTSGLLYSAAAGQGARCNGKAIAVADPQPLDASDMLVTRPNLEPRLWRGAPPRLTRHFRPSLAYRLALVAEGRFDGMLTLRDSWDWDVAAGALVAAEAGAVVTDRTGATLAFNQPSRKSAGVVAAPGALHGEIVERLAPGARTG